MGYTAFAIAVALALFLHSSVALDDRVNSQGNRKPSVLPDDIYEALINLAEGKALPPVKGGQLQCAQLLFDSGEPRVGY